MVVSRLLTQAGLQLSFSEKALRKAQKQMIQSIKVLSDSSFQSSAKYTAAACQYGSLRIIKKKQQKNTKTKGGHIKLTHRSTLITNWQSYYICVPKARSLCEVPEVPDNTFCFHRWPSACHHHNQQHRHHQQHQQSCSVTRTHQPRLPERNDKRKFSLSSLLFFLFSSLIISTLWLRGCVNLCVSEELQMCRMYSRGASFYFPVLSKDKAKGRIARIHKQPKNRKRCWFFSSRRSKAKTRWQNLRCVRWRREK